MDSLEFIHSMKDVLITYTYNAGTFDTIIQHANPKEIDQLEQDLQRIPELEAKAKAFDIFMKKYKDYCFLDSWEINTKTHKKEYIFSVGDTHEYITQEEYEILKKAGVE